MFCIFHGHHNYRDAYTLKEAADKCHISIWDVQDIAAQGKIRLHVWIPLMLIEEVQEYIGVRNNEDTTVKIIGRVDELMIQKRKALKRQRQKQSMATHDELFQSVTFKDMHFTFGGVQAEVIKQLYQAHQEGHPRIHFKILLKKAGSSSPFMHDIFRNKENWKKMIINDGRGYYWLHEDFFESTL